MQYKITQLITSHKAKQLNKITFIAICSDDTTILGKKVTCLANKHSDKELLGATVTITDDDVITDNRGDLLRVISVITWRAVPFEADTTLFLDTFKKA